MTVYRADLQVHSCLSPCGSLESSPRRIIAAAKARQLAMIALTDHNTTANCPAFAAAAARTSGVTPVFGAEVTTAEEIHVVCLFAELATAVAFGDFIRQHLAPVQNNPELFGDQPIVDVDEQVLGFEERLLVGTTDLALDTLDDDVHARGGLVIASHIDRPINSLFSQLGMWPAQVTLDACDLSPRAQDGAWRGRVPPAVPFVRTSDAHFLEDIGRQATAFALAAPSFDELALALRGTAGRHIVPPTDPHAAAPEPSCTNPI
jgi:PHP family Zn ribbon phosphoesterase